MDTPRKRTGRPPGARSGPRGKSVDILTRLRSGQIPAHVAKDVGVSIQAVCYVRDYWSDWPTPAPSPVAA